MFNVSHSALLAVVVTLGTSGCQREEPKKIVFDGTRSVTEAPRPEAKAVRIAVGGMITPKEGMGSCRDLLRYIKLAEEEQSRLIEELRRTLREVKTLRGLLPICASRKKIRRDQGSWQQVESCIREHADAEFSHGLCPECAKELYPEYWDHVKKSSGA